MKKSLIFLMTFFLAMNFYAQENERLNRPLYSLPKIMESQNHSEAQLAARDSTKKSRSNPRSDLPNLDERKKTVPLETANTLLATEKGLFKIAHNGSNKPLWIEGAVKQILPVKNFVSSAQNSDLEKSSQNFYFITDKGILFSQDLENFELRNSGLPTFVMKKFDGENTTYETHVQDLKDLAYNPLNPLEMVCATKERVFLSRDGGISWKNIGSASLRTNGIKSVAIASMKTGSGENARNETVVFEAHSILGLYYYRADAAKPDWFEAREGLASSDPSNGADEVADILPIVAKDENGFLHCEIYLSQTFLPRIYHFDLATKKSACVYKGSEPCDTIDALWQTGSSLAFMSPGKVGSYNLLSGEVSDLNNDLSVYFPQFTQSEFLVNAAWIPAENSAAKKIGGDILLNELWLLESGKILSPYAAKIDGQKSLYVPCYQAHLAGGPEKFKKIILDNKLNSLVIDMKDDYGLLRYDSQDELVLQKGVVSKYALNLENFVKTFKDDNIYLIARIVVFKDRNLSEYNNGAYAIWDKRTGRAWRGIKNTETLEDGTTQTNYYDEAWVDPFCPKVWEYNVAIAKELIARGFDEIQFDYIRFPTDGTNLYNANYRWQSHDMDKEGALRSFLSYARENISAPIGIDIYGANGWYRSGTRTGQDVETLAQYVDVICPMFYPSHFENKFMNYKPYEERPYRIYYYGTYRNTVIARDKVVVRPWVQAFFLNVPYDRTYYDKEYVLKEVYGVRDSVDRGYMFWNNAGNYTKLSPDPGEAEYTGASYEAAKDFRKPAIGPKTQPLSFYIDAAQENASLPNKNNLSILDSVLNQKSQANAFDKLTLQTRKIFDECFGRGNIETWY